MALFCELGPLAYAISLKKEIFKRHIKNFFKKNNFAKIQQSNLLPNTVYSHSCDMIKRGPGIDPELQQNKADNIRLACRKINGLIIKPGETFSFWHRVGKTSIKNGFKQGRVIVNGKLIAGVGGGLCNLANSLHLVVMNSPMTVTELHHHSDALAPDPGGLRIPYSAGTSVNYNFIDFRFKNQTESDVQLVAVCEGDNLKIELRSDCDFPYEYRITEEDHHFHKEGNGEFYRKGKIYRETIDKKTGKVVDKELKRNNRSRVMYDHSLIPQDQIR